MRCSAIRLIAIALIVLPQPVAPAVITVDGSTGEVADNEICTLPEAIDNANAEALTHDDCVAGDGADDIILTGDVTLTALNNGAPGAGNGLPVVTSTITIEGGGFTISRASAESFRIIRMAYPADLTLNNVTVSGGRIENMGGLSIGGGIFNGSATLTLYNSTLSGNTVVAVVSPFAYGGGLYNKGTATFIDSTVSGNSVEIMNIADDPQRGGGGAISNCGEACSGGDQPVLVLTNSTISGNTVNVVTPPASNYFSGAYGGGIYNVKGSTTITNSTVSNNVVHGEGFDHISSGGGIFTVDADLLLVNSTISGNVATTVGGYIGAAGIDYFGFGLMPTIEFSETLLGHHLSGYTCFGIEPAYDLGNNLADDTSCGSIPDTLTGLDAVLAHNGGPTETHALLEGSTAIDNAGVCGLAADQRGVARSDGLCDSGSYEFVAGCSAPQGEDFTVPDGITDMEDLFETCKSLTVNDRDIVGPDGHLILRTAGTVAIGNGFECGVDGRLTVEIDGSIMMPEEP